jgi:hypothetical protein
MENFLLGAEVPVILRYYGNISTITVQQLLKLIDTFFTCRRSPQGQALCISVRSNNSPWSLSIEILYFITS